MRKRLAPEEESALIMRAKAGDVGARNALVVNHLPLLAKIVGQGIVYYKLHVELDDALHEAVLFAMRAVERYDPGRGVKLGTYLGAGAKLVVKNLRRRSTDGLSPVTFRPNHPRPKRSDDGAAFNHRPSRATSAERSAVLSEALTELHSILLGCLNADELELVRAFYVRDLTEREMALELGVSRQWINQRRHKLLRKLRGPLARFAEDGI